MKNLTMLNLTAAIGVALGSVSVNSGAATYNQLTPKADARSIHAEVLQVMERQQQIDIAVAPIRSKADLDNYLYAEKNSPLNYLTGSAKQRFLGSLVFKKNGLASFQNTELVAKLSATQIYQVLSLFGLQSMTSTMAGVKIGSDLDRAIMSPTGYIPATLPGMACDGPTGQCVTQPGWSCVPASCH